MTTSSKAPAHRFAVRRYHGKSKSGAIKVADELGRYHFKGVCSTLDFEDGGFFTHEGVWPALAAEDLRDQSQQVFVAVGLRSKKLYLIRGELIRTWPVKQRTSTRKAMPLANYQLEIQRIKASKELGIDPMVSLPFVMRHTGRSAATVYRDISAGNLAKATKRGASSAWTFSAVDAYARGQRLGQLASLV